MSTTAMVESLFAMVMAGDESAIPVLEDAINEGVSDAGKARYFLVTRKAWKRFGTEHPAEVTKGAYAVVVPGKSVRLVGLHCGEGYDRTFSVGEAAEYDSFNLHYYGEIVSVGPSGTVTIEPRTGGRKARLDLEHFSWRNRDFDLHETIERNAETSMYL